ncbi:hypothetical protein SBA5_540058 [Candidatus Sulfotelmatomonas gaucii]|uniref:Uncharacterized protein n=1 Tax=Candidatus Sulfuritelmatomonas gaucii TaxID=2043161 RepID=A0A2N9LSW1_9BACT|nr:hypothetical protein SBA5_540058 [Candidatus Sulfotelmatomonas gaucii]
MQQGSVQQGPALAPRENLRDEVMCRFCGSDRVFRIYREGFLQRRIYSFFGFYPWRCRTCKANVMLHKRRDEERTRQRA